MSQPNICIGAPISNRQDFLPYYLDNILNLNFNRKQLSLYFIINNSQDDSEKILQRFKLDYQHEYHNITIDYYNGNKHVPKDERTNDIRLKHSYNHLSLLRNMLLNHTVKNNYSHLLSVDSDIMISPDTLNKLLSHNVDICSSLIWNGFLHEPSHPWKFPNILNYNLFGQLEHISNWYVKNSPNLTESKLIEVSATGACILISKEVCKQTKYSWHLQGEDMSWSEDCQKKGFKLHCDLGCYSTHCMSEQLLQLYIESKNKVLA